MIRSHSTDVSANQRTDAFSDNARIAIVLGGGWKLGASFHAGVLAALYDVCGIDARMADSVTGTSAGAVTAGFVAAGISPDDLFGRETGTRLSEQGRDVMARTASSHGRVRARRSLTTYFDDLMERNWPTTTDLRLCAVDLATTRLVALDASSGATPGTAVAASCSVPGLAWPVKIGSHRYVDGAVRSINNAQCVARTKPDLVIVSAPLSVDHVMTGRATIAPLRNAMRVQTEIERRNLSRSCQVLVVEPGVADVEAMGTNLNATSRRAAVAGAAYETARLAFEGSLAELVDTRSISTGRASRRPARHDESDAPGQASSTGCPTVGAPAASSSTI